MAGQIRNRRNVGGARGAGGAVAGVCLLLAFGCGGEPPLIPAEGGVPRANPPTDAATSDPTTCDPLAVHEDFWNCGECGRRCPPERSDGCRASECRCGNGPVCSAGSGCRLGRCVPSDPNGEGCEFDDECSAGYVCIDGHCSRMECVPEVCDGIDNDCDGYVDGNERSPLVERCFSGELDGELHAPCQQGYRICNAGRWSECMDEITPVAETGLLGCDGVDNDCDGCRDGSYDVETGLCVSAEPRVFDIAFVLDVSGSMDDEIAAVRTATSSFSELFAANPSFRFALLSIPGEGRETAEIWTDLTDFVTFDSVLDTVGTGGGALEPSYDAVWDLGNDAFGLTWAPDSARIIIVFTDERGQSSRDPAVTETSMCDSLRRGEVLAVVTTPPSYPDFDECATLMELTADPARMVENLETIISNPCD